MTLSVARLRHYLHDFQFEKLFIEELGWDRHSGQIPPVAVDGRTYLLRGLAQKRGVQIFQCDPDGDGRMPDHGARRKIEKQVTKSAYEHLIIFVDGAHSVQNWQWVAREHGQPAKYREYAYHPKHQTGELLVQKLQGICFPLSEEDAIDLTGTVHKLRDAFDRDHVTKKFYESFKKEHAKFLKFIKGVTETADREWYASLMLNRLMFVYFVQQKAFLDGDQRYLQNRLRMVQKRKGKGGFYTFYRYFLLRLFHEGFAQQPTQRAPDLEALLGNIPYLNGGLFDVHQLEEKYPDIDIPDDAFESIFFFFDQYEWTLDTRPLRSGKEINPDVLGYIFEKFVNQKQMGAYYTKEDITEYIGKNTIIPFLFDVARKKCAIAFEHDSALWRLFRDDPDRYIYEPVKRGGITENGDVISDAALPEFVQEGMNDPKARMFDKGYNLSEADLRDQEGRKLTLPTETWREYVNRRKRCLALRERLSQGDSWDINDLVTYNLNIRQFAEDAISTCEGPELLRAFYAAISSITILDPTCGSGAFLFAALNILEPLYEACIVRMEAFLEDLEYSGERHRPEKFSDFRRILAEIEKHPNRYYFILKSIIVNNLYGVDIMEEAVEICKLRLFLKLVTQVEKVKDLEPLPDIDFNIRPGNTLVGFARLDDVKRTLDGKLGFKKGQVDQISEEAEFFVDRAYRRFHEMQIAHEMDAKDFADAKRELRSRLSHLTDQLDHYLATEYGISKSIFTDQSRYEKAFNDWLTSHQPFHWFAEFYGIMTRGGFDVIIGNPPYVEYNKVKAVYSIKSYKTIESSNLYAFVSDRSLTLIGIRGSFGFIIPISSVCTQRMRTLQDQICSTGSICWFSNFAERPSKLFVGAEVLLAIVLARPAQGQGNVFTTGLTKWAAEERPALFERVLYSRSESKPKPYVIPKFMNDLESRILSKMLSAGGTLARHLQRQSRQAVFYRIGGGRYWKIFTNFQPRFILNGEPSVSSRENYLYFESGKLRDAVISLLSSSLFYWYFILTTNCRDLNPSDIKEFPIRLDSVAQTDLDALECLCSHLMAEYKTKAELKEKTSRLTGQIVYQEFYPRLSKPILNEIDQVLAHHYGFTDEELDFIVNYDIKYRMGLNSGEDELK